MPVSESCPKKPCAVCSLQIGHNFDFRVATLDAILPALRASADVLRRVREWLSTNGGGAHGDDFFRNFIAVDRPVCA
jgi:hypothetical protein